MTSTTTSSIPTLDELNTMTHAAFAAALGEVFEYAPWVAEAAAQQRPFASLDALHQAMLAAVHGSPREQTLRFLCGHPELSVSAVRSGTLTVDSQQEQQSAGLGDLAQEQGERLAELNQAYRTRHGFPFIACVRHYTRRRPVCRAGLAYRARHRAGVCRPCARSASSVVCACRNA
jgi:2-oxo-4-hydroxy-4-carboxy-5-ureidoimidazoline decarboxylase